MYIKYMHICIYMYIKKYKTPEFIKFYTRIFQKFCILFSFLLCLKIIASKCNLKIKICNHSFNNDVS